MYVHALTAKCQSSTRIASCLCPEGFHTRVHSLVHGAGPADITWVIFQFFENWSLNFILTKSHHRLIQNRLPSLHEQFLLNKNYNSRVTDLFHFHILPQLFMAVQFLPDVCNSTH